MESLQQAVRLGRYAREERPRVEAPDPFVLGKLLGEISAKTGVPVQAIKSERRFAKYMKARAEFCYRAFTQSNASLVRIGNAIGGRDHTTVRNAIAFHCKHNNLPFPTGVNWTYYTARIRKDEPSGD